MICLIINITGISLRKTKKQVINNEENYDKKIRDTAKIFRKFDFELIKKLDFKESDLKIKNMASIILENNKILMLSDEFIPKLKQNQILCASIKFKNSLNTIGYE